MYKSILVPLDGSELSLCVLPHLERLAAGGSVDRMVLLRAVELIPSHTGTDYFIDEETARTLLNRHREEAGDWLDKVAERLRELPAGVQCEVVTGRAEEVICDYATQQDIDLVVMATHGRSGMSRWLLGSVAERVLRSCCVPVLLVRPPSCIPKPT